MDSDLVRDGLSEESWQLLRVAAVLGRRFELAELASMMRRSVVELLPAMDPLLDRGLLEWAEDCLEFCGEAVWRATHAALPPVVLAALRADVERIRGAGRQEPAGDELSRAIALVRAALARPGAARLADDLHALLANLLLLKGQGTTARAAAERVLVVPDARLADEAAATRLAAMALSGDPDTVTAAEEVLATASPSCGAVAAAFVLSNILWDRGRLADSLRMARHRARSGVAPHWWLWQRLGLIEKLGLLRRLDEANELMNATQADSARLRVYEGNRVIIEAQLLLAAGEHAAAATRARAGVAAARKAGSPLFVPHGLAVQAAVALRADDLDTAVLMLTECEAVRGVADCFPATLYTWVRVRLAARRQGPRQALAVLSDPAARSRLLIGEPEAAAWLVRTALAAEETELAGAIVREAEQLAAGNPGFATLADAAAQARTCLDGEAGEPREQSRWDSFSDVERAIARLVADGMTNRQIATRVRLSPHTVNYHLRVLFRKLDISSRAELVRHVPNSTAA
ncbi:helix-turn-helix transcriptional regulator [Actinophytocola sp.]|uniref:helix-turn-helix transcriptional regulator n=1 Tax=Actinophytocola sp. TaxID=1872138 RepID=UPI002D33326B|nr:helix-turn-helix transcriptional regulator [Actinophytocola sp.]HYQ61721.1 helix-turn-helix transcriptional regulator [Actinophytocola sp.]